jgi:hypothetical protein
MGLPRPRSKGRGPIQSSDMRGSLRLGEIRRTPRAVDAALDEDFVGGVADAGFGVGCRCADGFTTWSAEQCPCPIRILDFLRVSEISRRVSPPRHGQRSMTYGISEAATSDGIRSKNAVTCVSSAITRRVREIVEWSGGSSSRPAPRKSRSANESAARQAMPRSESMPSKYPINSSRK